MVGANSFLNPTALWGPVVPQQPCGKATFAEVDV